MVNPSFDVFPIGMVHSSLKVCSEAPRQGSEGAPKAGLEIYARFVEALEGIEAGQQIWILTWLHQSQRDVLKVHPRDDLRNPLTGVFATRSQDRPNPVGLHRATVVGVENTGWLEVSELEAINGTPILDIKPVLGNESY